ncbi:hypothetical protein MHZ36_11800 [Staphylococcus sp. ACRSN]|uniref:hypothetical protein n=1 Tax=Staphylococcus sp. ACRSN TaxID=2918214 RepID=UPI001EF19D29|nr:hypothetical protein [Staphylococcus sp. ACRSN]MCG7339972.1 hypothetical protein [Staphylococcus sp. ACRSN]
MYKFLYVSLVCGIISGAGIFLKIPHYPNLTIPVIISLIGIISAIMTIKDKKISGMLRLGGILINVMPLLGAFTVT